MNVYTCSDFPGHYPVSTAAVIVADNEEFARGLLAYEMTKRGLLSGWQTCTLVLLNVSKPHALILLDGDY